MSVGIHSFNGYIAHFDNNQAALYKPGESDNKIHKVCDLKTENYSLTTHIGTLLCCMDNQENIYVGLIWDSDITSGVHIYKYSLTKKEGWKDYYITQNPIFQHDFLLKSDFTRNKYGDKILPRKQSVVINFVTQGNEKKCVFEQSGPLEESGNMIITIDFKDTHP